MVVSIPGASAHLAGLTAGSFWPDFAVESMLWLAYYVLFHASKWQATPGKHAFGIKVTDLEGRRVGRGRSLARYLASIVSALAFMVGYLMVPFTRRRQAMHDMIAGTLVVDAALPPGVVPPDREAVPLSARDVSLVAMVGSFFLLFTWVTAFVLPSPHETERIAEGAPAGPSTGAPLALGYALYEFPYFGGEPKLAKEGMLAYRLADVRVSASPGFDDMRSEKRLAVVDGFTIAAQVERTPALQGFALQLEKDFGFSWEWFDRVDGGYVFQKRQGPGRVQVRLLATDGIEEVAEILFLEDTTLRIDRNYLVPLTGPATEHLVVRKGSLLRLAGPGPDPS